MLIHTSNLFLVNFSSSHSTHTNRVFFIIEFRPCIFRSFIGRLLSGALHKYFASENKKNIYFFIGPFTASYIVGHKKYCVDTSFINRYKLPKQYSPSFPICPPHFSCPPSFSYIYNVIFWFLQLLVAWILHNSILAFFGWKMLLDSTLAVHSASSNFLLKNESSE